MSPDLTRIFADFDRMRRVFDLTEDRLGEDLCKAATDGVQECFATSTDPDGNDWDELSEPYATVKAFEYNGAPIGVRIGVMSDPDEVAGELEITPEEAVVTYGKSEEAKQEAVWFQEGDSNQPPREFWGLTRASEEAIGAILDQRFDTFLR